MSAPPYRGSVSYDNGAQSQSAYTYKGAGDQQQQQHHVGSISSTSYQQPTQTWQSKTQQPAQYQQQQAPQSWQQPRAQQYQAPQSQQWSQPQGHQDGSSYTQQTPTSVNPPVEGYQYSPYPSQSQVPNPPQTSTSQVAWQQSSSVVKRKQPDSINATSGPSGVPAQVSGYSSNQQQNSTYEYQYQQLNTSQTQPMAPATSSMPNTSKILPLKDIFGQRQSDATKSLHYCILCPNPMQVEKTVPHPWAHCTSNTCAYTQNVVRTLPPVNNVVQPPHKCTVCFGDLTGDLLVRVIENGQFAHADWAQCEMSPIDRDAEFVVAAASALGYMRTRATPSLPRCAICVSGAAADTIIGNNRCVHKACLEVERRRADADESAKRMWTFRAGGVAPSATDTGVKSNGTDLNMKSHTDISTRKVQRWGSQ